MNQLKIIFSGLAIMLASGLAFAQPDNHSRIENMTREEILALSQDDLLSMSMEDLVFLAQKMGVSIDELLNMKTNVASKTTLTPRETPGIVSFITEEEIRKSGARDLIDVLRLVPGYDFGSDVSGVFGVGSRGNWVHEGKILMLIDGQPMNEMSYFNIPFGNHFAVDQIKRIEIIRGPGSAVYGGNAELGVINIITKSGKDMQGVEVSGTYGQMQKTWGRANLNINSGFTAGKWDFSAKGYIGKANRSDQSYVSDLTCPDVVTNLSDGGGLIKVKQLNLGATDGKLSLRFLIDDYRTDYNWCDSVPGYGYDSLSSYTSTDQFRTILSEIKYNLKINDKLTLVPKLNYRYNRPFYEEDYWRNYRINQYAGSLGMNYQANDKLNLMTGLEYINNSASCLKEGYFYTSLKKTMFLNNIAWYGEGTYKLNKLHFVAGFRVENSDNYGWAWAPRAGITGVFNNFHFKALFSEAFRTPGIGNIDACNNLKPEKSYISELEFGYRINDNMFATVNFFDIKIEKSIVYYDTGAGYEPIVDWGYANAESAGNDGFELEYKIKYPKFFATVNYSFSTQAFRSLPDMYSVPGHDNYAMGLCQSKIGINASYSPVEKLSISPSLVFMSKKYGYSSVDEEGNKVIGAYGPYYLLNVSLTYQMMKGLSLNLSGYDLLNQKPDFVHPYDSWYGAYPGSSREILFKMVISTDILKK